MTCPSLTGTYLKTCSATPDVYSPSAFQFKGYDTSSWHTIYPLFRLRHSQHGQRTKSPGRPRTRTVINGISRLQLQKL